MVFERDFYEVLQLHPSADPELVESAYRGLARKYEPATGGSAERMAELNAAYEVLSDPTKRAQYDAWRIGRDSAVAGDSGSADQAQPAVTPAPVGVPASAPSTSNSPLRWLLVVPATIAGSWIGGRVVDVLVNTFGPEAPWSFVQRLGLQGGWAAAYSSAGIVGGVLIAPKYRKGVATWLGAIYVLFSGFLMFPAIENGDWWSVYTTLIWAASAIVTAVKLRDAMAA